MADTKEPNVQSEREAFEAWAKTNYPNGRVPDNAWIGWQARASCPIPAQAGEREALKEVLVIAAELAQRKPLRSLSHLEESTHIGHRQFHAAFEPADEACRLLSIRLREAWDILASRAAAQAPAPASNEAMRTGFVELRSLVQPNLWPDFEKAVGKYAQACFQAALFGERSREIKDCVLAGQASTQAPAEPGWRIDLSEEESAFLRNTIGHDGDCPPVTLSMCQGHSGWGLYVWLTEYPDEGSSLLCKYAAPVGVSSAEHRNLVHRLVEATMRTDPPIAWLYEARHIDTAWGRCLSFDRPVEGVYCRNIQPLALAVGVPASHPLQAEPKSLVHPTELRGNKPEAADGGSGSGSDR